MNEDQQNSNETNRENIKTNNENEKVNNELIKDNNEIKNGNDELSENKKELKIENKESYELNNNKTNNEDFDRFEKLKELQLLIKKESAMKELCKKIFFL